MNVLADMTKDWLASPAPGRERGSGAGGAPAFLRCWRHSLSMPRISIREREDEICRGRSVRRLCRTDLGDDGGSVACPNRTAPCGGPFRSAATRLAPGAVRVRFLHDRAFVHRPRRRALSWTDVER